jgi:hypothetical protein
MKKLFHVTLALMLCVSAAIAEEDIGTRVDGVQAQVNRVLSKAGIHFGGEFRSQFLNSQVSGNARDTADKRSESAEYTSVDFDVVARPNSALSARAVFRLHQDWRNFFSDVQNPIVTRWLSIDGNVAGMFDYHAGDYLKKLTPLTLWAHEYELLYEPEIFAEGRRLAMSEAYMDDSKRLLQGADLSLRAELYPILKEIDVDAFGARLATRGTKESAVVADDRSADFDRYLIGANLGTQIIHGFGLGVSDIYIFDYLSSYLGFEESATHTQMPQATNIAAGRLNFDTRTFMDDETFLAGINAEAAYSSDKNWKNSDEDTSVTGMAVNLGLSLRLAFGEENNIKLSGDYVINDSTFRNDAAQTPSFMQRQIMNSENALSGLGMMNPFDAMYRSVFKYVPSQYFANAQPQTKNAYNNVILSPKVYNAYINNKEGNKVESPNVFQAALPGGLASADRTGPVVKLDGAFWDKAVNIGLRAAALNSLSETPNGKLVVGKDTLYTINPDDGDKEIDDIKDKIKPFDAFKNEYQEIVGGLSFDIAKFAPAIGPSLVIGGSGGMYNAKGGELSSSESILLSGFLNYNFYTRFSFLVGYQQLGMSLKSYRENEDDVYVEKTDEYTFQNLAVGLGYKVADGGALTFKLTMLSGKLEPENGGKAIEYTAMQPEVYLTVKF